MMYIYPQSLDYHSARGCNVGIKIQFMAGEDPANDALQVTTDMTPMASCIIMVMYVCYVSGDIWSFFWSKVCQRSMGHIAI